MEYFAFDKNNNPSTKKAEQKWEKTSVQKDFKWCCLFVHVWLSFPIAMSILPGGPNQAIL